MSWSIVLHLTRPFSYIILVDTFARKLPFRNAIVVGLLLWLIFLFSTLGISASGFFTPNLATSAQWLGLDENSTGVMLLTFRNGSLDVFSTFSGLGQFGHRELLGAARCASPNCSRCLVLHGCSLFTARNCMGRNHHAVGSRYSNYVTHVLRPCCHYRQLMGS